MNKEAHRIEILQVADMVAREKGIEKEQVIEAMELAIQKAGRAKYGQEHDIRAHVDRSSGDILLRRYRLVVKELDPEEEPATQILLEDAKKIQKDVKVGEHIIDDLPPIDFGRVAAQTARQVIVERVREAERSRQYEEFKDRVGEVINGLVKRIEFGNVFLDLGRSEGLLKREEIIPREHLKVGDRVRAYIAEVRSEPHGAQVFLSRTHPQFMAQLFEQEVPEIYDGVIEIKSVARDPGSRAKIAVYAADASIDPVGACVGMRGARVQAVISELQGEKIDIILWSSDIATFIVNALAPAEVSKVIVEEEQNKIIVVVPDDQLSLGIGRRGQNVRLAAQLTGWEIDLCTESTESQRRLQEIETQSKLFMEALDVDEVLARLIATEGFGTIEEIAYVEIEELMGIEGFNEELAQELQNRAADYLENQEKNLTESYKELGVSDDLANLNGLTPAMLVLLGESQIKTLDDFANLATDEVTDIFDGKCAITEEEAGDLILAARAHWFEDDHHTDTIGQERVEETEE